MKLECKAPLYRFTFDSDFHGARLLKDGSFDVFASIGKINSDPKLFSSLNFDSKIGCGSCGPCRLRASAETAMRIMHEAKQYKHNYFLTLTYDDNSLRTTSEITGEPLLDPFEWFEVGLSAYMTNAGHMFNKDTGELIIATFWKSDVISFMKRLRRYYSYHEGVEGIRFFLSGEYGEISNRPHFHLILLNSPDLSKDFKLWSYQNYSLYESETLKKLWKLGRVIVGELNFETAAYTARYCMKKLKGKALEGLPLDNLPYQPWCDRSRRPGLGSDFVASSLEDMLDCNSTYLVRGDKAIIKSLPRFYINKLEQLSDPEAFERFQKLRDAKKLSSMENLLYEVEIGNYSDLFDHFYIREMNEKPRTEVVRSSNVVRKI